MSRYVVAIAMMLAATTAGAAPAGIVLEAPKAQPKDVFIPLDSARPQVGDNHKALTIPTQGPGKKPMKLRSDMDARNNGMMLLDRRMMHPLGSHNTLLIEPAAPATLLRSEVMEPPPTATPAATETLQANPGTLEPDSEEIEGNGDGHNPILSLFGAAGTTTASFRDVMAGRSVGSVAGVGRQVVWPVSLDAKQYLSSGYGMRADPFTGRATFHGGIDIAAPAGTPVMATSDATVMEVEQDRGYGKYITLQHSNGMLSRYGHLSMQSVREGQHVRAGEIIGAVGATGRATGAHLDYRVSKDGLKFDPLAVLSVPTQVAMKVGAPVSLAVAVHDGRQGLAAPAGVASHPLRKSPMVIEVH